ncbi:MAG: nonribosomal peptide synthetase MxaA [Methylocella sp.]
MRKRRTILAIFCLGQILLPSLAQSVEVEIQAPRQFGYFVGDLIEAYVGIRTPQGAELQPASLPTSGPLNAWLTLRGVTVSRSKEVAGTLWHLHLTYQNFYLALDVREVEIPALSLTFQDGGEQTTVEVPSWRIRVAPLREVLPEKQENAVDYLRPDAPNVPVMERGEVRTGVLASLTVLLALLCLRDRALWPFHKRRTRVFTAAARQISALAKQTTGPEFYPAAFRTLHRSLEKTAGHAILFEDLPAYLRNHPQFAPLTESFQRFFEASREAFFSEAEKDLSRLIAKPDLLAFAWKLAALERTAP